MIIKMKTTMESARAEKLLAILYSSTALTSVGALISFLITWQHWAWTLDVCIDVNCGCILYAKSTFSTFMGGDVKLCHFGVYGLVPIILIGAILGLYHGYRTCIPRGLGEPRVLASSKSYRSRSSLSNGQVIVVGPKVRSPCKQWMPAACLAVLICCLSLAHAVVLSDGYFKSCDHYRKNLVRLLNSTGEELKAILHRLNCGAIFDFMDYVQPDTNNWRRGNNINTGLALQIAIGMAWLNFFIWGGIFLINIYMARKRFKSLNEKMCCFW